MRLAWYAVCPEPDPRLLIGWWLRALLRKDGKIASQLDTFRIGQCVGLICVENQLIGLPGRYCLLKLQGC